MYFFKRVEEIAEGSQGKIYKISNTHVKKVYSSYFGQEYADIVDDPARIIAEGERDAWNAFYTKYYPDFATAEVMDDGSLKLPFIQGTAVSELEQLPEDIDAFRTMFSEMLLDATGIAPSDQKDDDIFLWEITSRRVLFFPVDFGEYGVYKLMETVMKIAESQMDPK